MIAWGLPWSSFGDVQKDDLWLLHQDQVKTKHSIFRSLSKDSNHVCVLKFTNKG